MWPQINQAAARGRLRRSGYGICSQERDCMPEVLCLQAEVHLVHMVQVILSLTFCTFLVTLCFSVRLRTGSSSTVSSTPSVRSRYPPVASWLSLQAPSAGRELCRMLLWPSFLLDPGRELAPLDHHHHHLHHHYLDLLPNVLNYISATDHSAVWSWRAGRGEQLFRVCIIRRSYTRRNK